LIAFVVSEPEDVDINETLSRPSAHRLRCYTISLIDFFAERLKAEHMRQLLIIFIAIASFNVFASCDIGKDAMADTENSVGDSVRNTKGHQMNIRIGNSTFTATLADNETAAAFKARLPLTITMIELNGNEKYTDLSSSLPNKPANPGTIQAGDLMLYGSSTLVLFYKTFSTTYSYTKLGKIEDVAGLTAALGSGNVTVTFELQQ
jgi:hypothetical protein